MRIVFMGTPNFALTVLKKIYDCGHEIVAVITQPDKPSGRGHKIKFSPVKIFAQDKNLNLIQPESLKNNIKLVKYLNDLNADIFIVAAYGKIIPESILYISKYGSVNVHASLLPKYRGAAPIQHAIINGETTTGVTIIKMDKNMDTGDIILQKKIDLLESDNYQILYNKLADLGAEALLEVLYNIDNLDFKKQDDSFATYAPMIDKKICHIDWHKTSLEISNLIRALEPHPGAYSFYNKKILKIYHVKNNLVYNKHEEYECGKIISVDKNSFTVKTFDGALDILRLQEQGGKILDTVDYLRGHKLSCGEFLE